MRAKEYLEIYKSRITYYDIVKNCVYDLYKIRKDYLKTQEYFDERLFGDVRYRVMTNNLNCTLLVADFVLNENEIPISDVVCIRKEIMNVIYDDETFVYAYNILAIEKCKYASYTINKINEPWEISYNTPGRIDELCKIYKEDYPKVNLADFFWMTPINVITQVSFSN